MFYLCGHQPTLHKGGRGSMRAFFALIGIIISVLWGLEAWAQSSFNYQKSITIDRRQVGEPTTTTLSNFPMLFNLTDPALKHKGYAGGHVENANGHDIIFQALDDATCGGAGLAPCSLDHEIERYNASTGELIAWVRLPSVNAQAARSDTVICLNYGNASITAST